MAKVWFVGAGPGDPDLITVRGRSLLARAGAVLYAGSLVSSDHLQYLREGCSVADSSSMTLEEMVSWLMEQAGRHGETVRLQTGDPGLYGALAETAGPLLAAGIEVGVIPGVSSAMAAAAAAVETLTLPEITQTVIFTRVAGRTPMPSGERLRDLARHRCTLCLFLSATLLETVTAELLAAGWPGSAPILVVHKVSWPGEERVMRTTVVDLVGCCRERAIQGQAMIIASPALTAIRSERPKIVRSRLYDPVFSHGFRDRKTN
ncbi:MAG: precorrin-4 C(11)-methyltransferase [Magnetococcales bacterium]|nr:precorrin-4 C(11)-methyltransferase [Magnetococcales bacterium]